MHISQQPLDNYLRFPIFPISRVGIPQNDAKCGKGDIRVKTPMIFVSAILFAFLIAAGAFWGGMSVGRAGAQSDRSPVNPGPGLNPGNLPPNAPFPSSLGGVQPGPSAGGPFPNAPGGFADASAVTGKILQVSQDTLTLANDQGQMI